MTIFNGLKNLLIRILNTVLFFLPDSPFTQYLNVLENNTLLRNINWVIPISDFIAIGEAWLAAIAIFYIYQVILRWAKAIE